MDLTACYSNHAGELAQLRELLKRITARDQSAGPGLDREPDQAAATQPPRPRRLADRLPADAIPTMITKFPDGTTIAALAAEYGICRSSVKNILRRHRIRR